MTSDGGGPGRIIGTNVGVVVAPGIGSSSVVNVNRGTTAQLTLTSTYDSQAGAIVVRWPFALQCRDFRRGVAGQRVDSTPTDLPNHYPRTTGLGFEGAVQCDIPPVDLPGEHWFTVNFFHQVLAPTPAPTGPSPVSTVPTTQPATPPPSVAPAAPTPSVFPSQPPNAAAPTFPTPAISAFGCTPPFQVHQVVTCSPSVIGTDATTVYTWYALGTGIPVGCEGECPSSFFGHDRIFSVVYPLPGPQTLLLNVCNVHLGYVIPCAEQRQTINVEPSGGVSGPPTILSIRCGASRLRVDCGPYLANVSEATTYLWSFPGGTLVSNESSRTSGGTITLTFASGASATVSLQACNGSSCATHQQTLTLSR